MRDFACHSPEELCRPPQPAPAARLTTRGGTILLTYVTAVAARRTRCLPLPQKVGVWCMIGGVMRPVSASLPLFHSNPWQGKGEETFLGLLCSCVMSAWFSMAQMDV